MNALKSGVLIVALCSAGVANAQLDFRRLLTEASRPRRPEARQAPARGREDACNGRNDRITAAGTGTAVGALGGVVVGGRKGVLVGSGIGLLGGLAVGQAAAQKRKQYCSEAEYLDSEIQGTQVALSAKEQRIRSAEQQLAEVKEQVAQLENTRDWNNATRVSAQKQLVALDSSLQASQAELTNYQKEITYLDHVISTSGAQAADAREQRTLEAKKTQLLAKRQELATTYARLVNTNTGLAAERTRMYALVQTRGLRRS